MSSVYLSANGSNMHLRSEHDIQAALDNGVFAESHFLDLKRSIPSGRSKNIELARDLASFAIDGGTLLVGVGEERDGSLTLDPVQLAGLAERVDQVAAFAIDPPLSILTQRIQTNADSARGYLVIQVPASPLAPHAVDGRYLGRGDTTKRYLSDAESCGCTKYALFVAPAVRR